MCLNFLGKGLPLLVKMIKLNSKLRRKEFPKKALETNNLLTYFTLGIGWQIFIDLRMRLKSLKNCFSIYFSFNEEFGMDGHIRYYEDDEIYYLTEGYLEE